MGLFLLSASLQNLGQWRKSRNRLTALLLAGLVLLGHWPLTAWSVPVQIPAPAAAQEAYYLLRAQGQNVGYVAVKQHQANEGLITEVQSVNHFRRNGLPYDSGWSGRFVEAPVTHQPVQFEHWFHVADAVATQAEGRIDPKAQVLDVTPAQGKSAQTPIRREQFMFPVGQKIEQVFQSHYNDEPGSRFAYQTLHLAPYPQVVNAEAVVSGNEQVFLASADNPDQPVAARKFTIGNPADPASQVTEWRDANGRLIKAVSDNARTELVYASRQAVKQPLDWDALLDTQIPTSPIALPRQTTRASFRLTPIRGADVGMLSIFSSDARQQVVESADGESIDIKIEDQVPSYIVHERPIAAERMYSIATPYIESDHPAIVRQAREIAERESRAYFAARLLRQWVHQNIKYKTMDIAFATARETLDSRTGDCTEHAVLLAALSRALGIPARVAVGLVYVPQEGTDLGQFVFHMWTEVNIGTDAKGVTQWVAMDASQPEIVTDATHIKLGDSALSDLSELMRLSTLVGKMAGYLRIDVLSAMASNASNIDLKGQVQHSAQEIPKIDLERVDIRALSKANIQQYRVSPLPETLSASTPEGLFSQGLERLQEARYDEAISSFQQASRMVRTYQDALQLGKRLMSVELYGLAHELFAKAGALEPDLAVQLNPWLRDHFPSAKLTPMQDKQYLTAIGLLQQQNYDAAKTAFQQFLQEVPEYEPAYLHLGEIAESDLSAPQPAREAISAYQAYIRLKPNDTRGYERLGELYINSHKPDQAAPYFLHALQVSQRQGDLFSENTTDSLRAKVMLTQALQDMSGRKSDASVWLKLGHAYRMLKQTEQAKAAYQNALRRKPGLLEAHLALFELDLSQPNWPSARSRYYKVISRQVNNSDALRLKGYYEMRQRQYALAVASLKQAERLDASNGAVYDVLASVYTRMAELEQQPLYLTRAYQTLEAGVRQAGSANQRAKLQRQYLDLVLKTHHRWMTNQSAGGDAVSSGVENTFTEPVLNRALQYADALIEVDPTGSDIGARVARGRLLILLDRTQEAEVLLKQTLKLSPYRCDTLSALGYLYQLEQNPTQAIAYYQKALAVDSNDPVARFGLRQLIIQQKLALKKPDDSWSLSDDEMDYLIQHVQLTAQAFDQQIRLYRSLNKLVHPRGEKSVQANEDREAMVPVLDRFFKDTSRLYDQIQHIRAPRRMERYRFAFAQQVYAQLVMAQFMMETLPTAVRYDIFHKPSHEGESQVGDVFAKWSQAKEIVEQEGARLNISFADKQAIYGNLGPAGRVQMEQRVSDLAALQAEFLATAAPSSDNPSGQAGAPSAPTMPGLSPMLQPASQPGQPGVNPMADMLKNQLMGGQLGR